MNQCIFQWAVPTSTQAAIVKAALLEHPEYSWVLDFDWDALGRGCDGQLAYSKSLIAGDAFSKSLDSVITAAKQKLASELVPKLHHSGVDANQR
jgi:hypothetical protein